ncbi:MAG: hypothetical protein ACK2U5_21385 [Candidatus Promineifilaceae bacterium]
MTKKWFVPLLLALPFIPILFWGAHLTDAAYASLRSAQHAATWQGLVAGFGSGYNIPATPLFPIGVGLLSHLGLEPARAAALLGTLGWGVAAAMMYWFGRKLNVVYGSLVAAALYCLNPWIVTTLGEATGWIMALIWLLANFLLRKRYAILTVGALFLLSLFFRPSQGLIWPAELAGPLIWSILLFATGAGLEWLAAYLVDKETIRRGRAPATAVFLGLFTLLVLFFQIGRLRQVMAERPRALWSTEEEVAAWLRENSSPNATLLAANRLAYLADRESIADSPGRLRELIEEDAPDFVVTGSTLPWQLLHNAIWFRLYYEPLQRFGNGNTGESNMEIWTFREPQAWLGPVQLLNARVPDRLSILGYQMDPQPAISGLPVNLALYLQAPRASLIKPAPFQVILRLTAPLDGGTAGQWTVDLPRTMAPEAWQPEQVIVEPLQIEPPPDLESGAYPLNMSLIGEGDEEFWPISFNNDVNRLDRIPLGYVVVPWLGSMEAAEAISANFAGGIHLAGYEIAPAAAGETMAITLYWQPSQAVDDNYVVFVHLLDEAGQLVANHDGRPAGGRFPSDSWLPGMTIPDRHELPLPQDLAAGSYEIRVGMYDPDTGARLPLNFVDGKPVEADYVSLGGVNLD